MKWVKRLLVSALIIYLAIAAIVFALQRKMLYFPPDIYLAPEAVQLGEFEEIQIQSVSGDALLAWWSPPAGEAGKVILFFHGNASAIYTNHDIFKDLIGAGHGVMSIGYVGYPGAGGKPTQKAISAGVERQYDYLVNDIGISPQRLVYYGTSLGSGIAAQLAAKHLPALLIMEAPFNSVLDIGQRQMPFLPAKLLMKDQYRSDQALKDLHVPLIWMHGTADEVIPMAQGQKLYDGYTGPKSAHIFPGGQHKNLWGLGGREIVLEALKG